MLSRRVDSTRTFQTMVFVDLLVQFLRATIVTHIKEDNFGKAKVVDEIIMLDSMIGKLIRPYQQQAQSIPEPFLDIPSILARTDQKTRDEHSPYPISACRPIRPDQSAGAPRLCP